MSFSGLPVTFLSLRGRPRRVGRAPSAAPRLCQAVGGRERSPLGADDTCGKPPRLGLGCHSPPNPGGLPGGGRPGAHPSLLEIQYIQRALSLEITRKVTHELQHFLTCHFCVDVNVSNFSVFFFSPSWLENVTGTPGSVFRTSKCTLLAPAHLAHTLPPTEAARFRGKRNKPITKRDTLLKLSFRKTTTNTCSVQIYPTNYLGHTYTNKMVRCSSEIQISQGVMVPRPTHTPAALAATFRSPTNRTPPPESVSGALRGPREQHPGTEQSLVHRPRFWGPGTSFGSV